ncbi:MAG: hypothetical protein AAF843_10860 [Bacteroidota bacterium]
MRKRGLKRKIVVLGSMIVSTLLLIYYFISAQNLQQDLLDSQKTVALLSDNSLMYQRLASVDSLLLTGSYDKALQSYSSYLQEDSVFNDVISLRVELAQQLITQQKVIEQKKIKDNSPAPDSLIISRTATPFEVRKYDSISFALEKALLKLNKVNTQLKQRSFGEYLEFKSSKGNTIYYVGQVKGGKANGRGMGLFKTGSRYEGHWKNNERSGEGTFYWPDGQYYIGSYVRDRREGKGTYYWPNGDRFEGDWENDQRNGRGTFYNEDGKVVARGLWVNDELIKEEKN